MANKKISELPAAGTLTGVELVEVVDGGINSQTTTQAIAGVNPYTTAFPQFDTATSTTAYTGTPSPAITAYATGQRFQIKVHATSTGAATLNLNVLGAKKWYTSPTTQVGTGDVVINTIYLVVYDATLDSGTGGFLTVGGGGGGAAVSDASETVKGVVEEATDAQVTAGTATGETGAKLFVTPAKLATRLSALSIDDIEFSLVQGMYNYTQK